jgi:putative ABC transport system substrate-binding protein
MIHRLGVAVIAAMMVVAPPAGAQVPEKVKRIAVLSAALPRNSSPHEGFEARLRELGHIEGGNLNIAWRSADGDRDRLPALASELVRLAPDVIYAAGPADTLRAVRDVTRTIPIVFVAADYDPLALGLIESFARPGANVTGISMRRVELTAKRLEALKELLPQSTRIAVFHDAFSAEQLNAANAAAAPLGLQIVPIELRQPYDFRAMFATARRNGAAAVLAGLTPVLFAERERVATAAIEHGMPTMFGIREMVAAGGFAAYGPNLVAHYQRAADYVHKILDGAKPSDMPVEQSTSFEMVVNLKTARAIGLEVPPLFLARADEVIE